MNKPKYIILIFILFYFCATNLFFSSESSTIVPKLITLTQKIQKLQPKLKPEVSKVYSDIIKTYCMTLDEDLVISIIQVESSFNFLAENKQGDVGLFQINLYVWGKELNTTRAELLNPILNIEYGCQILKKLQYKQPNSPLFWGSYHNRHKRIHTKYIKRVQNILKRLDK